MSHSDSILPVDHWTKDLSPVQLLGLVQRHHVVYELVPSQKVQTGTIVREGWMVDLYGRKSASDMKLPPDEANQHIHDVLHAVAVAVTPSDMDHITVELSPYSGAVHINPHEDYAEEVRLRILIHPTTDARPTLIAAGGSPEMEEISHALEQLGVKRR